MNRTSTMTRDTQKDVLTTGEVAEICHVAPRTVSKWFDSGKLKGYRVPGSRSRRIPRGELLSFMRTHGMPLDALEGALCRVLLVGYFAPGLIEAMEATGRYELTRAESAFAAGICAQKGRPHVVALDVDGAAEEARVVCRGIKADPEMQTCQVVAIGSEIDDESSKSWLAEGFDGCLAKPFTPSQMSLLIQRVTSQWG
jgi:excisionase family DNA binding protein